MFFHPIKERVEYLIMQYPIKELLEKYSAYYDSKDSTGTKQILTELIKLFPNITVKSIDGINLQKIRNMYNDLREQEWFNVG